MYILGLNAYHPDSSAAIILNGRLIAACEEERFKRVKHWSGLPLESIKYCLDKSGIGLEDLDYISLNRNPRANLGKKIIFSLLNFPSPFLLKNRFRNICCINSIKEALCGEFKIPPKKARAKLYFVEHHLAHLASAFFVSPFQESTIVSLDGFGDFSSAKIGIGRENKISVYLETNFPHSLGLFYTALTQFLGFKSFGDEYKVMGLAAYGQPRYLREMQDLVILKPRGGFALNLKYFSFYKEKGLMQWCNTQPVLPDLFSGNLREKFGVPREATQDLTQEHYDLAASLQAIYEKAFFHMLNYAHTLTNNANLCLAGGCVLNSVANGKIFANTKFKEVYIQPAASDAGGSLGSGYYLYHQILGRPRVFEMKDAYWGPDFNAGQIGMLIEQEQKELGGCIITKIENMEELCRKAAEFIAAGLIVGWFQGRMEWGPRALGNRSILADSRKPEMKDILNARIKKREWFRPFAPSVLLEKTGEYFEINYPDPFMLKVYPVRKEKRGLIPAVVHVDGTGRLQTVSKEENPLYWRLISEFEKITGIPIVLNTSFNENEPIVCNPQEALDCFQRTRMDILVLGNFIIQRTK